MPLIRRHARGFTLIEMMAAVGILAIISSAVFLSNSEALQNQVRLEEQTVAQWALANRAAYYKLSQATSSGSTRAFVDSSLAPRRVDIGGYELELTADILPSPTRHGRKIRWEAYRIVEHEPVGPIRSLVTWVTHRP